MSHAAYSVTGDDDHAWFHSFTVCPGSRPMSDWLSAKLTMLPIYFDSIDKALWLQFPGTNEDTELLPAVWLVGEALTYAWL